MWERGPVAGLGGLEPEMHKGAGLAAKPKTEPPGLGISGTLKYNPS